jgi:hypothetical protein
VQDAANGPLFTSTAALTAATTYRVEMQVDTGSASNNGTIAMQYFAGDSTTAIQSFPGTGVNAGSGVSLVRFQLGNNDVVTIDTTFDDIRISSGSMTPIGPYSPTTIYTINDSIGITDTGTAAFAQITQTLTPEAIGITDSIVVHYSTPPPAELKTTTDYEYGFLSGFTTKDTMIDRYMKGPFPDLQYMGFGAAVITHYGLQGMTVAEALRYYYGATSTETLADARIRFFKTYYGIPT